MPDLKSMLTNIVAQQKEQLKQLPPELCDPSIISDLFESLENLEIDDTSPAYEERDFECFNYDLQALEVMCDEGVEWDSAAEAKVDEFLADWPAIRPRVLKALCEHYKEVYPDFLGLDAILMPAPGDPQLVDDRVRIDGIHLREDGRIGLSGECTWEDEHALGVLLENGEVLDCGYHDVAISEWCPS